MTDEKQIEEIIKETIYQNATSLVDDIDKQNNTHHYMLYDEDIFHIAKRVKEKLSENAVMLTKGDYNRIRSRERQVIDLESIMKAEEKTRKEIAQEFFNLSEECGGGVVFYQKARQLAKKYGVKVK